MECFHWLRHHCQQLVASDRACGWYSTDSLAAKGQQEACGAAAQGRLGGKRRTVIARRGPYQAEYHDVSKEFQGNAIRTTKYSLLSFVPMNLFQQFQRVANLYFLFLVLLNWVPAVEAFQKEITMVPLVVVLIVIAFKDALEDYRRYLFDKKVNDNLVRIYSSKQNAYIDQHWQDVRVGDFIRLSCNEIIPADVLLLYSSDPRGICYIETANLDGETNLKQRQVVTDLPLQGSELTPESFYCRIECENPNYNLGRFRGYMEHSNKVRVGLHNNNLLLRSCTVRNTDTIIGIVIYAGHETKAMKNNSGPRYKQSRLERRLNMDVLWCVLLLFAMCLTAAIGHGLWLKRWIDPIYSIAEQISPTLAGFYVFWTMIIVLQVLIPISLYVSIEIVKLGQIYFIQNDLALYNEQLDSGIQCRALNITEDLGQIQFLFSDKTGTLTENKMVFQCCTIYGVQYPHKENGVFLVLARCKAGSFTTTTQSPMAAWHEKAKAGQDTSNVGLTNPSDQMTDVLQDKGTQGDYCGDDNAPHGRAETLGVSRQALEDWASGLYESRQMAIDDQLVYEAESPDEAALVHAAQAYHCTLRGRSVGGLTVDLLGTAGCLDIHLLHVLPFDATRKRMSVVVRHPLTGQVVVYAKGADSVIMDLAKKPHTPAGEGYSNIREQTQKHLDNYARDGLRTLCIAKKVLDEEHYEAWLKGQLLAETSIENREELLMESAQRLETNLTLLGATGIVDRLQEEVPETIEALQRAGIKVWVLTGDKQETAVNIACACKLLGPNDQILTANCGSKDACEALLQQLLSEVGGRDVGEGLSRPSDGENVASSNSAAGDFILIMDGQTLEWALKDELKGGFLELSRQCKAVICCRSTPLQKSQVVQLVRNHLNVLTLAIGDGANDVSMIQVADVGIGISGQEGMQAVMSSDFAISRFKHLRKLLLVHGHWCYSRLANMILYFFYKNVMYVNLLFWYQFFSGFSGSVMTNSWILILFNLLFTSVPPLVYGVLDRDTPAEILMEWPELYRASPNSKVYVSSTFWLTILDAFYQSLVCFFIPYLAYAGSDVGVLAFGSPINASALLIILLHQIIESNTLMWMHIAVLLGSGVFYFVFTLLFSMGCVTCSPPTNPVGVETLQMSQPLFYMVCALTTVTALLPRVLIRALLNSMSSSFAKMDKSGPKEYVERMRWWNRTRSRTRTLRVSADDPGLEPSDNLMVS
ncbi:unnamed protein product [Merluccius merluccius]